MKPVHDQVPGTNASEGLRQIRRKPISVNVDHQRRIVRIVETLSYTHAEKRGVAMHQVPRDLLLDA